MERSKCVNHAIQQRGRALPDFTFSLKMRKQRRCRIESVTTSLANAYSYKHAANQQLNDTDLIVGSAIVTIQGHSIVITSGSAIRKDTVEVHSVTP